LAALADPLAPELAAPPLRPISELTDAELLAAKARTAREARRAVGSMALLELAAGGKGAPRGRARAALRVGRG